MATVIKVVGLFDGIGDTAFPILREGGLDPKRFPPMTKEELLNAVEGLDYIMVRSVTKLPEGVLRASTTLKGAIRIGAGLDTIDIVAAAKLGILVAPSGGNENAVAELTVASFLNALRRVPRALQGFAEGCWVKKACEGRELSGMTIGVVGLGPVGRAVARKFMAMGCKVYGCDPSPSAVLDGVEKVNLNQLCSLCDGITFHVNLNTSTQGIVSAHQIEQMRTGVILANFSRGPVFNHGDVLAGLDAGKFGCVIVDVFDVEPTTNTDPYAARFQQLGVESGLLLTPHLGASTVEAQRLGETMGAQKLVAFYQRLELPSPSGNFPPHGLVPQHGAVLIFHPDKKGMVHEFSGIISDNGGDIHSFTNQSGIKAGGTSYSVFTLQESISPDLVETLRQHPKVLKLHYANGN